MSFPSSIKNALLGVSIADADAAVGDVKDPKTFYSVTPPKKTGTIPTVAIAAGSSAYLAGYHAGNAGGLEAVDADLVAGNIKSGVAIFGKTGPATVQDISGADAAVGEVKSPKTFFSVSGAVKTGTMPTQSLDPASESVPAGYYAATTLSAVDADLAVANIGEGKTIFGKAGTLVKIKGVVAVSDTILAQDNTEYSSIIITYITKSVYCMGLHSGALRLKLSLKTPTAYAPIARKYRRGVGDETQVGVEHSTGSSSYVEFSEDTSGWSKYEQVMFKLRAGSADDIGYMCYIKLCGTVTPSIDAESDDHFTKV